eukprot:TRINITY_DN9009_c0_g1_i2.p2 TRINITY_DN9009_c0_g1~~TRINITY_DN9009_c0_g1_i2.p2  ORF type:complete len:195 (-),score=24.77 TRINITY_DN9009_c0_g1_i2:436-1020(-)
MIRQPPRSTLSSSSAASDVYKRQNYSTGGLQSKSKKVIKFKSHSRPETHQNPRTRNYQEMNEELDFSEIYDEVQDEMNDEFGPPQQGIVKLPSIDSHHQKTQQILPINPQSKIAITKNMKFVFQKQQKEFLSPSKRVMHNAINDSQLMKMSQAGGAVQSYFSDKKNQFQSTYSHGFMNQSQQMRPSSSMSGQSL